MRKFFPLSAALPALLLLTNFCSLQSKSNYIHNSGAIYGTIYQISYESPDGKDLHQGIKKEMNRFDNSLSTFNPNSIISRINKNEPGVKTDLFFRKCFLKAAEVSKQTDGAFDITVAPLVNAWGFGFERRKNISTSLIDSLLKHVGYKKVRLAGDTIQKDNPMTMLDASAIAKGQAVDVVANFLLSAGCINYIVEIGGEIIARGVNKQGRTWRIGINKPEENTPFIQQDLQAIIKLKNKGLATSGNYRNFYVEDGKKYAHTIDPRNGYPVQHNLLSASVIADDCITADAFATAFMVLGLEKAIAITENTASLDAYFIYSGENGENRTYYTSGFNSIIVE